MTLPQMALAIRFGSGIICMCLTKEKCKQLSLPMMVQKNNSKYQTAFTVSIESASGITTGVSAHDRLTTIKTAIQDNAKPTDLNRPGHVFPLRAKSGGVLCRAGHTEAAIDLTKLAGLKPAGVICEVMNDDGSMARMPEILKFSHKYNMPVLVIKDIISYRLSLKQQ
uniref:3,4-dihydroxy-2-butanone 4-phosphate synthase n=1 Tax=Glossina pallidipes TaxID=7398 RepID=A0A1A9Z185_GLOPL